MKRLEGLWRLVDGRAWDGQGRELAPPYGRLPFGEIMIRDGRMLAALCKGDADLPAGASRGFSSYGGRCSFDGSTLVTLVDMASDPQRVGGEQRRGVVFVDEDTMILHPPPRDYEGSLERRELRWQRVWRPDGEA